MECAATSPTGLLTGDTGLCSASILTVESDSYSTLMESDADAGPGCRDKYWYGSEWFERGVAGSAIVWDGTTVNGSSAVGPSAQTSGTKPS